MIISIWVRPDPIVLRPWNRRGCYEFSELGISRQHLHAESPYFGGNNVVIKILLCSCLYSQETSSLGC